MECKAGREEKPSPAQPSPAQPSPPTSSPGCCLCQAWRAPLGLAGSGPTHYSPLLSTTGLADNTIFTVSGPAVLPILFSCFIVERNRNGASHEMELAVGGREVLARGGVVMRDVMIPRHHGTSNQFAVSLISSSPAVTFPSTSHGLPASVFHGKKRPVLH